MAASCASGAGPISYAWEPSTLPSNAWPSGFVGADLILATSYQTTTYAMTPSNASGAGPRTTVTVYIDGFIANGSPNDCRIVQFPDSSVTPVAAGTTMTLSVSCASGGPRFSCGWNNHITDFACNINIVVPAVTTMYQAIAGNILGPAPAAQTYVQVIGSVQTGPGGQYSPAGCTLTQTPDSQANPVAAGTPVTLAIACASGEPVVSCSWMDVPSTNCTVVVTQSQTSTYHGAAVNSFGVSSPLTSTVQVAGSTTGGPAGNGVQAVARSGATLNGSPMSNPAWVKAGDVVKFDTMVTTDSTDPHDTTGLGLCLLYAADVVGNPTIRNLSTASLIGGGSPNWLQGCNQGYVLAADTQIVEAWAILSGTGWPAGPLPFKLYDAEFTLKSTPRGSTQIGFAASSVSGGHRFAGDAPAILCGKPTVKAARVGGTASPATFVVSLSSPVPMFCGTRGVFTVRFALSGSAVQPGQVATDFKVTGMGVESDSNGLRIDYAATGYVASTQVSVAPVNGTLPDDPAALSLVLLPGDNYIVDLPTSSVGYQLPTTTGALQVSRDGGGAGTVTSNLSGIDCGAMCSQAWTDGTLVTLTATPSPGSLFAGWLGACTGRGACDVTIAGSSSVTATFVPDSTKLSVDIDGNGKYDALTDGLLMVRYLFGLVGPALTSGALAADAQIVDPAQVLDRLRAIRPLLDIDGNGRVDALSDGVLLLRYIFGLRGAALVGGGVVAPDAKRATAEQIAGYIAAGMP